MRIHIAALLFVRAEFGSKIKLDKLPYQKRN